MFPFYRACSEPIMGNGSNYSPHGSQPVSPSPAPSSSSLDSIGLALRNIDPDFAHPLVPAPFDLFGSLDFGNIDFVQGSQRQMLDGCALPVGHEATRAHIQKSISDPFPLSWRQREVGAPIRTYQNTLSTDDFLVTHLDMEPTSVASALFLSPTTKYTHWPAISVDSRGDREPSTKTSSSTPDSHVIPSPFVDSLLLLDGAFPSSPRGHRRRRSDEDDDIPVAQKHCNAMSIQNLLSPAPSESSAVDSTTLFPNTIQDSDTLKSLSIDLDFLDHRLSGFPAVTGFHFGDSSAHVFGLTEWLLSDFIPSSPSRRRSVALPTTPSHPIQCVSAPLNPPPRAAAERSRPPPRKKARLDLERNTLHLQEQPPSPAYCSNPHPPYLPQRSLDNLNDPTAIHFPVISPSLSDTGSRTSPWRLPNVSGWAPESGAETELVDVSIFLPEITAPCVLHQSVSEPANSHYFTFPPLLHVPYSTLQTTQSPGFHGYAHAPTASVPNHKAEVPMKRGHSRASQDGEN